jgi:hypothetical protein
MFDGKTFFTIYDSWMLIITLPTRWDGEAEPMMYAEMRFVSVLDQTKAPKL